MADIRCCPDTTSQKIGANGGPTAEARLEQALCTEWKKCRTEVQKVLVRLKSVLAEYHVMSW